MVDAHPDHCLSLSPQTFFTQCPGLLFSSCLRHMAHRGSFCLSCETVVAGAEHPQTHRQRLGGSPRLPPAPFNGGTCRPTSSRSSASAFS